MSLDPGSDESLNEAGRPPWAQQFRILSEPDLDFVIGQRFGLSVGTSRDSPAEFRRRIFAAVASYQLGLTSIDWALKRYVEPNLYDDGDQSLGDEVSDFVSSSVATLMTELRSLHTPQPTFGQFGAEITLYRIPHTLNVARRLSNRGLLLEVLPILRLCLEMAAWANVAFYETNEEKVASLSAQSCLTQMKDVYESAGRIYGYLSRFSHWGHIVHGQFLDIKDNQVGVLEASVRYRAMSLGLCLVILDVFVDIVRKLYGDRSERLILAVQGTLESSAVRNTRRNLSRIVEVTELTDLFEIRSLMQ